MKTKATNPLITRRTTTKRHQKGGDEMKAHKSVLIGILATALILVSSAVVPIAALAGGPNYLSPQPEPPDSPKMGIIVKPNPPLNTKVHQGINNLGPQPEPPDSPVILVTPSGVAGPGPQPEPPDKPNAGTPMPIPPSSPTAGSSALGIAGISPQPEPPSSPASGLNPGETNGINPQPEPPMTSYFQNLQQQALIQDSGMN
jgi:hypothetical protein